MCEHTQKVTVRTIAGKYFPKVTKDWLCFATPQIDVSLEKKLFNMASLLSVCFFQAPSIFNFLFCFVRQEFFCVDWAGLELKEV